MLIRPLNPIASRSIAIHPQRLAKVFLLCLLALMIWVMPGKSAAQATGQLSGVVADPTGSVIPKAKVELISAATAQVRTATSGGDGSYLFPLVAPGTYQVRTSVVGFKTSLVQNVEVQVNGTTHLDIKLEIGATSQEVTVTGAAPLVETSNATLGNVVNEESVVDLPLNGRNFAQLGTLIPGVVAAPSGLGGAGGNATIGGFGDSTGSYNVNGMRNQSNSFLMDGAPNNDSFNSGFVMRPPPDAIEEFKIMSHSYEAEYGRNAGSVVNVVTKSGSNKFHGDIWDFNREGSFAARNFFATVASIPKKPAYLQNQFGGAAQGPIIRDKLFISGFYEGFRLNDGTANTLNVLVPGTQERGGNFSELLPAGSTCASVTTSTTGAIIDPLTGTVACYNGTPNAFNPTRISAISTAILSTYIPASPNGALQGQYKAAPPNIDNRNQFGFRGDWKFRNHAILGRFMYAHQNLFSPTSPSNFAPKGNVQLITPTDYMGSDTWTINSHMINVGRFVYQHIHGIPNKTSGLSLTSLGYQFAGTNATAAGLPNDTISGSFSSGDAQQPFAYRANGVTSVTDDFTWIHGKHQFKFGGEYELDTINLLYINRPNGNFTFTTNWTKNGLSDFLLGLPATFQQGSGNPALNGSSQTYGFYGQDEYRVRKNLTLQYGLRYELNLPFVEQSNHLAALVPGQQSTVQPTAPVGLVYPGDKGIPRATYFADTTNFAPRLGVIYDPFKDGRTSVRGAWGLFYDTVPGQGTFFQDGTLAPPFQPLQQISFTTFAAASATSGWFANPYNYVPAGAPGFPPGLTYIGWQLPNTYKSPRIQQYNLSVQRQVSNDIGFEVGYVGSKGVYIPIFIEVNPTQYVATGSTTNGANYYKANGYVGSPFPSFALTRPTFSAGNSWYNSLQANLQLRNYHHIQGTASYTWSHSIDNASGLNIGSDSRPVTPVTIGNQASVNAAVAAEKGPSLYDARNRFVLSLQYVFPSFDGRPAAERLVLGGWNFNTIFQVQSGSPFSVVNSTTTAQSLTFRPNKTCNPNSGAQHNITQFFNTTCFALPTIASGAATLVNNSFSGNEGRNSVLGPGFNSTDASLFKSLSLNERYKVEFRFEVFNIFNEAHFSNPGGTFGTASTYGIITSTIGSDQRIIQLAAKASF